MATQQNKSALGNKDRGKNVNAFYKRTNQQITSPNIRLVSYGGGNIGIYARSEALSMAKAEGLDLIELEPDTDPPVCILYDYKKFQYEQKKHAPKKHAKVTLTKELYFRPNIGEADLLTKVSAAKKFIAEGHKVRAAVKLRGREISHPQLASIVLDKFKLNMQDVAKFEEAKPDRGGRQVFLIAVRK